MAKRKVRTAQSLKLDGMKKSEGANHVVRRGSGMISNEDRRILEQFSSKIHKRFSNAKIWAFGSRSRGTADWDSDFDICIVLDHVDRAIDAWIREVAWEVGFENERLITTIVLDFEQFERGPMSESTLVGNILQDGVAA